MIEKHNYRTQNSINDFNNFYHNILVVMFNKFNIYPDHVKKEPCRISGDQFPHTTLPVNQHYDGIQGSIFEFYIWVLIILVH